MGSKIIRCKYCRHRFYAMEERCPECGRRSPQGRLKCLLVIVLTFFGVAATTLVLRSCLSDWSQAPALPRGE
jgi:RNA polymerase subunit RPABC4/transcription elongation factor Spt4